MTLDIDYITSFFNISGNTIIDYHADVSRTYHLLREEIDDTIFKGETMVQVNMTDMKFAWIREEIFES